MSLIYFTRHGRVEPFWEKDGDEPYVSRWGVAELEKVRAKLDRLGFQPTIAFSSRALRCQETVSILAPNAELRILRSLADGGDHKYCFRLADGILREILEQSFPNSDILVSCHDHTSVALAYRLLQTRGVHIKFGHIEGMRFLQQGCGVLVSGNDFTYINPYNI